MRLRIAVDGRDREVTVDGEPPEVRVTLDGRTLPVKVRVDGTVADVEVDGRRIRLEFGGGVRIAGQPRAVQVTWVAEEVHEGGENIVDVRPPMPGRIVRVLVTPGESVRRGSPLVVLEAMKMQNEVPAPVAGIVREIHVKEGDQVAASDALARLERRG